MTARQCGQSAVRPGPGPRQVLWRQVLGDTRGWRVRGNVSGPLKDEGTDTDARGAPLHARQASL